MKITLTNKEAVDWITAAMRNELNGYDVEVCIEDAAVQVESESEVESAVNTEAEMNETNETTEKPWYPDEGNWIEHDGSGMPDVLIGKRFYVLDRIERSAKAYWCHKIEGDCLGDFKWSPDKYFQSSYDVVAYKLAD